MKELNQALEDIAAIRGAMARAVEFHGFGPLTVAATGVLAAASAVFQARFMPGAARDATQFLTIWVSTGVFAVALIGVEMVFRSRAIHSGLAQEMIASAIEQLVP